MYSLGLAMRMRRGAYAEAPTTSCGPRWRRA